MKFFLNTKSTCTFSVKTASKLSNLITLQDQSRYIKGNLVASIIVEPLLIFNRQFRDKQEETDKLVMFYRFYGDLQSDNFELEWKGAVGPEASSEDTHIALVLKEIILQFWKAQEGRHQKDGQPLLLEFIAGGRQVYH